MGYTLPATFHIFPIPEDWTTFIDCNSPGSLFVGHKDWFGLFMEEGCYPVRENFVRPGWDIYVLGEPRQE